MCPTTTKMTATEDQKNDFWPPFENLHNYVNQLKFELRSIFSVQEACVSFLNLYRPWLVQGLSGFKPREGLDSQASDLKSIHAPHFKTLENGLIALDGMREILVDERMRVASEEVSKYLDLNQRQSLYLLHLWMNDLSDQELVSSKSSNEGNKRPRDVDDVLSPDGHLTMNQLALICQMYCDQRFNLLKSLEIMLWIVEETVESDVRDYIESFIEEMLKGSSDIETVSVKSLKSLLGCRNSPAHKSVILYKGKSSTSYNWAEIIVQGMEREITKLLSILMLIYYRPRKACAPERFLEILMACRGSLFRRNGGSPNENLSNKLVSSYSLVSGLIV